MEEIIESTVNAEPAEVVAPINEQSTNNESSEVVDTQVDNKPTQSAEENAKYAAIRREAEQKAYAKAQDDMIATMYGKSHGIYTKADYDKAVKAQQQKEEAEAKGIDPELYKRMADLEETVNMTKAEKAEYERQLNIIKEDTALQTDETFGDYYKDHSAEIKEMANQFKVDLQTALLLSIKDNFKAIKEGTTKKAQQETINNIIKNGQNSPGSVANGGHLPSKSIKDLSSTDFNKLREAALRGEVKEF